MGMFTCYSCLYQKKRKEKAKGSLVSRDWINSKEQTTKIYLPQVGDLVVYIAQAHEDFINQNFDHIRFSKGEIFPFERLRSLLGENVCKVRDIKYQFPLCPKKYKGITKVSMKITLQIMEGEEKDSTFTVSYFETEDYGFLVPQEHYIYSIQQLPTLQKETIFFVRHHGEDKLAFLSEVRKLV